MCIWLPDADAIEMDSDALNILFVNNRINNFYQRNLKVMELVELKGKGKPF